MPKNKFGFFYTHQPRDVFGDRASVSPESMNHFKFDQGQSRIGELVSRRSPRGCCSTRAWPRTANRCTTRCGTTIPTASGGRSSPSPNRAARFPGLLYRGAGQAAGPTFIFAAMDAPYIWEATRLGHLRHRRARVQGRVSATRGVAGPARARHPFRDQLPLQQRHSESDHHARVTGHAATTN